MQGKCRYPRLGCEGAYLFQALVITWVQVGGGGGGGGGGRGYTASVRCVAGEVRCHVCSKLDIALPLRIGKVRPDSWKEICTA